MFGGGRMRFGYQTIQGYWGKLVKYWNTQSGNWNWLTEKPIPLASLNRSLWRMSVPSLSFHLMLGLSSVIATLGLLANSVAIVIGAMIIAPLMGPIIGMAYSIVLANRRLLRRSSLTVLSGVVLTIITAYFATKMVGLKTVSPEILARTNPTLLDLGVAVAAGAAGAFANSRRRIAEALPGVAISVALVPPISVIGIGLALDQERLSLGATLLFLTNLTGIVFSGGLVFLAQSYGTIERAKRGLLISLVILSVLGLPLGFSLKELLIQENVRRSIVQLISQRTVTFSDTDIRTVEVRAENDILFVDLEVAARLGSISPNQINLVRDFLAQQLQQDVQLNVRVVPVEELQSQPILVEPQR